MCMDLYSRKHGELGSLPKWKEKQTRTGLEVSWPEVQSKLQLCYQPWEHQGDLGSLRESKVTLQPPLYFRKNN